MEGVKRDPKFRLSVVIVIASVAPLFPCSRVSVIAGEVKRNFEAKVTDPHGKVLEGVKVEIREIAAPDLDPLKSDFTNNAGLAHFQNVEPGRFALCYSHLVGGDCPVIQVGDSEDGKSQLELQWPAHPIQKVRKIAGTFLLEGTKYALSDANVSLTDAWTGDPIGTATTDVEGRFTIDAAQSGLYVLRVQQHFEGLRPRMLLDGNIFVEVSSDADQRELPVFSVTMSSCGLTAKLDEKKWVIF